MIGYVGGNVGTEQRKLLDKLTLNSTLNCIAPYSSSLLSLHLLLKHLGNRNSTQLPSTSTYMTPSLTFTPLFFSSFPLVPLSFLLPALLLPGRCVMLLKRIIVNK